MTESTNLSQAEQPAAQRKWTQIWSPVFVFLIYASLTIFVTWPVVAMLNDAVPGSEGDALNHLWTFRSVKQAFFEGSNPFYTYAMYYPHGVSLLTHNIAWVHIAAWLPLQVVLGESAAYSLVFLLIFPLNGVAMFCLARDVTGSDLASFIGGLIVAFWPYLLSHHNHPNLILIAWVLFALLFLRRLLLGGRFRDAAFAAIFLALIGLTRWQMLLIAAPLFVTFLPWGFTVGRVRLTRHLAGLLLATAAGALLLMAPLLIPVTTNQMRLDNPDSLFVAETPQQTDLLAYFLPNRYHPLWGEVIFGWYENVGVNKTFTPFLGFTVLILAVIGLWRKWKAARFWLVAALVYLLLALGSSLRVNGVEIIPLPTKWLENLFLFQVIRHPDRFNVLISVPLAMLASFGAQALENAFSSREYHITSRSGGARHRIGIIVTAVCAVFILGEFMVRYPVYPLDTPEWYEQLAKEPGDFGVLDLPLGSRSYDKEYMLHQITHGKSLVGGHVSRLPDEAYDLIDRIPLLQSQRENPTMPPEISNVSHQLGLLQEEDVRYLVLHKKFLTDDQEAAWQTWLVLPPIYTDKDVLVYKTAVSPEDILISQTVRGSKSDTPAIGLIGSKVSPGTVVPGAWVRIDRDWSGHSAIKDDYRMCLQLVFESDQVLEQCATLAPDWPTSRWQEGEVVHQSHSIQVDPFWPPGSYAVAVSLQNGEETTEAVAVNTLNVDGRERQFDPPNPSEQTDILWGKVIQLVGYETSVDESLDLSLHWKAAKRMEASYKVFVHMIDTSDGSLVAQTDFIPQEWTYPTNWWDAGEYIADNMRLPLDGFKEGKYELLIGLYDSATGERLPAYAVDGSTYRDAVVPLTTISIP